MDCGWLIMQIEQRLVSECVYVYVYNKFIKFKSRVYDVRKIILTHHVLQCARRFKLIDGLSAF